MKMLLRYIPLLLAIVSIVSCKKDNFDPPGSFLTGHIVYKGEAIQVEKSRVSYELYQYGFGKVGQVTGGATFAQDGSYSQVLFDGTYKLIIPNGQGPFMWKQTAAGNPDTTVINLSGSQSVDLEVTPYYMIRNAQITAAGGKVAATFKAEKIIVDLNAKDIESVSLYINKTQFVSGNDNIAVVNMANSAITDPNNISLNVTVPAMVPAQNYVYARVGLKIAGVEDLIFSPLQKITY